MEFKKMSPMAGLQDTCSVEVIPTGENYFMSKFTSHTIVGKAAVIYSLPLHVGIAACDGDMESLRDYVQQDTENPANFRMVNCRATIQNSNTDNSSGWAACTEGVITELAPAPNTNNF